MQTEKTIDKDDVPAVTHAQGLELDVDKLRDKLKSRIDEFNAGTAAALSKTAQEYAARAEEALKNLMGLNDAYQHSQLLGTTFKLTNPGDSELAADSAKAEHEANELHRKATVMQQDILEGQTRFEERLRSILMALTEGMNKVKAELDDEETEMGRTLMEMKIAADHDTKVKAHKALMALYDAATNAVHDDYKRRTAYAREGRRA